MLITIPCFTLSTSSFHRVSLISDSPSVTIAFATFKSFPYLLNVRGSSMLLIVTSMFTLPCPGCSSDIFVMFCLKKVGLKIFMLFRV